MLENVDADTYPMKFKASPELIKEIKTKSQMPKYNLEENFSHNVSELSVCIRKRWYSWKKIEPIVDEGDRMENENLEDIFEMGKKVEEIVINRITRAGLCKGEQVRLKKISPQISGAIDCVIEFQGRLYPVEIKSANVNTWDDRNEYQCPNCNSRMPYWSAKYCKGCNKEVVSQKVKKKAGFESRPSLSHYCQLQMYMNIASNNGALNGQPLVWDRGFLVYFKKDDSTMLAYEVEYDAEIIEWLIERAAMLDKYIADNKVPMREHTAIIGKEGKIHPDTDWECRYCPYIKNCWKDEIDKAIADWKKYHTEKEVKT